MITARCLAGRLLETDEDFDPVADIKRYTANKHPGIEVESAFNHWDVYKTDRSGRRVIGSIYYDDMEDAPVEVMSPEAQQYHEAHRWTAVPMSPRFEPTSHKTFEEALDAIALPLQENVDPDDPASNVERFATERNKPVARYITTREGREFKVRIVWDKEAGGTSYYQGKIVPKQLQPIVEFYDMTHADDPQYPTWKGKGQFVSSYFAATLVEREPHTGLDLQGGVPAWQIDWMTMDDLIPWITQEVEAHGYKLVDDEAGGISFGKRYESIDPDDPELYTHPERFDKQPSDEKIEGALRRMLLPYYPSIHISKRPGLFHRVGRVSFKDSFIWTIHCNRDTPLPLPSTRPFVGHRGPDPNSWRKQVKHWFEEWAQASGLHLFRFEIYGRLRKDPTFQFETARLGPLKESEDDPSPEAMLAHYAATTDWTPDLYNDLWKFHPYGVGYEVLDLKRAAYVVARTYFQPDKNDFAQRFRTFVQGWFEQKRIFPVKFVKLYAFKHAQATAGYDQWSTIAAVNIPWPDTGLPEYDLPEIQASSVEVGKSPIPPDPPQV